MKTVPFSDLNMKDFAVTDISVIYQTPSWDSIGGASGGKRVLNGFLFVDRGSCRYEWQNGKADLCHGGLIYLATGSTRIVTVTKRPFSFYRICFKVTDLTDGEQVIFDEMPWVVTYDAAQILFDLCAEMQKNSISRTNIFKTTSLLYEFFHIIHKKLRCDNASRISPAIEHLDSHYTCNVDILELSRLCFLSKSHFFRLFKEETGMTPLQYKNNIIIEHAKRLLSDGECSVGEIAEILGFENIYYFSRIFKKLTGIPPSSYNSGKKTEENPTLFKG